MEQVFVGEYIKQRRTDLGLTQAQLCEGICEPMTVSRLERGKQAPSYNTINALLQRLGLPGNRYFALLSKNEADMDSLQKEILADKIQFARSAKEDRPEIRKQALKKMEKLEQLMDPEDHITQQYILSAKTSLGGPEGPYSPDERLTMLLEAIRLTVPRFDPENIGLLRYSMEETKIMNQIAVTYVQLGQKKTAFNIYRQLLQYIGEHDRDLAGFAGHSTMVAHNYAIDLTLEKRYGESLEIAEEGCRVCVRYGNYQFLPGFSAILAECFYFTGNLEQSKEYYFQAYYLYKAVGDRRNLEIIRQEMEERLGRSLPHQVP